MVGQNAVLVMTETIGRAWGWTSLWWYRRADQGGSTSPITGEPRAQVRDPAKRVAGAWGLFLFPISL